MGLPPVATVRGISRAVIGSASTAGLAVPRERIDVLLLGVSIMSLPFIPETMTPEEFESHMKTAGSSVYLRDDAGELYGEVRYDYGYPTSPWIFDYLGECGRDELVKKKTALGVESTESRCVEWRQEPYIRRFKDLISLLFFVALVGLEYS